MKQPELALVAFGFNTGMQVVAPAIEQGIRDAGGQRVAYRPDYRGNGRPEPAHVLTRPGTHCNDQVDILLAMQALADGLPHRGALIGIEVAWPPVGIGHE